MYDWDGDKATALRDISTTEDMASMALFLASDESRTVKNQTLKEYLETLEALATVHAAMSS